MRSRDLCRFDRFGCLGDPELLELANQNVDDQSRDVAAVIAY